ncbi:hypothetical protein ACEPAG_3413 [Sanghuangporus baumii]
MASSNRHQHGHSEHRKATGLGTNRNGSAKSEDKRPKLIKLEDARKQILQLADSIRKDHIKPLMTRVLIYSYQSNAINQLGEALQDVAKNLQTMHDADEHVRQILKELKDRNNAGQNRSQDRHLLEAEYERAENVRKDREDDWQASGGKFIEAYEQAKSSVENGIRSKYNITSKQDQENKEVASFLENTVFYVVNKRKNLEHIEKVLGIVSRASGALDELLNISDWPAIQQLNADLVQHQENWKSRLERNEGGVIKKSLLDDAKKEMADLQSRAEKIKAQEKKKENLKKKDAAKGRLKMEMREIRKLSEQLRKEGKK